MGLPFVTNRYVSSLTYILPYFDEPISVMIGLVSILSAVAKLLPSAFFSFAINSSHFF